MFDTIADLSVKCTTRHCKVGIFIRNHKAYCHVSLDYWQSSLGNITFTSSSI